MSWRSIIGRIGALAALGLVLAPQAQARDSAKFQVLSIDGTTTSTRNSVYAPSDYGSCAFTQTEQISFHSTQRVTAFAFTSRAHGRARVAWSPEPTYSHNFTVVEVPAEMTVSRSATYEQTSFFDPDLGGETPGCWQEPSPADCTAKKTFPVALQIGGTSITDESTYILPSLNEGARDQLDAACPVLFLDPLDDAPGLFARAALFKNKPKRLGDTDTSERAAFDQPGGVTETGVIVEELAAELKRKNSG